MQDGVGFDGNDSHLHDYTSYPLLKEQWVTFIRDVAYLVATWTSNLFNTHADKRWPPMDCSTGMSYLHRESDSA